MPPYIYIYIYIYTHSQTVSLYYNSSVWLDMQGASSWDRNQSNFMLDLISYSSDNSVTYGKLTHFVLAFVGLYFALSDTGVLNSSEEL